MSWRQDHTRPVRWTKDGRLVYNDYIEKDPILKGINAEIHELVIGEFTRTRDHELAKLCGKYVNRKKDLGENL